MRWPLPVTPFEVNKETKKEELDNLRRYETTRREQLGAAVNLILGLAAAATGFCVSQITAKETHFSAPGTYFFLCATLVFILTVGICMLTMWTRLRNFRATANKLRAACFDAPQNTHAVLATAKSGTTAGFREGRPPKALGSFER